jgi:hypothetical protein
MKYDEANEIVDNVLTEQEIQEIYKMLETPSQQYVMKRFNQKISDFKLPEGVERKVIKHCENISGETGLMISEYQFARYTNIVNEDGSIGAPVLSPHYDETFKEPRFTFDYQMRSNTSWPLVVEEREYALKDNQALTFSGTHQIHWRTKKIFSSEDFIDMIFFHLRKTDAKPKGAEVNNEMNEKAKHFIKVYEAK